MERENITIDQGATYTKTLALTIPGGDPYGLTGCILRGQIRTDYDAADVTASFTATITDDAGGLATLSLSATTTAGIPAGRYVYDVELVAADTVTVTRLYGGYATVTPEVTR